MATATQPRTGELKLEYGATEVVALKFVTAKVVDGNYGPRCLFTLNDDRRLWLDGEDGADLERRLRDLGVQRGDLIAITKIRHPRGGGHSLRVDRVPDAQEQETELERRLRQSIELARTGGGAAAFRTPPAAPLAAPAPAAPDSALGKTLVRALLASIDAYVVAADYARSKGLPVELHFDITGEDIRTSATAMMIEFFKQQGGAR